MKLQFVVYIKGFLKELHEPEEKQLWTKLPGKSMISVGAEMMFEDVFGDESIIGVKTFGVKSMSEKEKITNLYFFHV